MQTRRGFSKKRGAGILTVLTASTLLLLLGLTVAGTSFHHLSVSNRLHHSQNARNLAEDCLSRAAAQVLAQPTRYLNPNYSGFTPLPSASAPVYERGVLTFDASELNTLNGTLKNPVLICSLNNLSNESAAPIGGGVGSVPPHSLYLRAVGVDHGVERAMECVLWIPPFPYAMASGGPIKIAGASNIASVDNIADAADPTKWLPGSLVSNDMDATKAIELKDNVTVTGDIQTRGGASILDSSLVKGEKRYHAPPVRVPTIKIEDYDTSAKANVLTYSSATPSSNQVNGFAYRDGALNYNSGIKLNNGVVYVKGDLTINGQISGKGALIATGTITINGSGSIASNNEVAILSKSDVTLTGTSSNHVGASGLIYSEGKLTASYADISGSAAAPKDTSSIEFTNVNMVQNSTASNITVQAGPPAPPNFNFPTSSMQVPYLGAVVRGGSPVLIPSTTVPVTTKITTPNPSTRFKDTTTGEYHIPIPMSSAHDINGNPLPPGNYESLTSPSGVYYQVPSTSNVPPLTPAEITVTVNGVPYQGDDPAWQAAAKAATISNVNQILGSQPLTPAEINTLFAPLSSSGNPMAYDHSFGTTANMLEFVVGTEGNSSSGMIGLNTNISYYNLHKDDPAGPATSFTLNPAIYQYNSGLANGNFINLADNIRILYWREVPLQ